MHVVVIHHWQEENPAVTQTVADALGMLVFEMRQRMVGGGPVVIASYADPQQAEALADGLQQAGVPTLVIDTESLRTRFKPFLVRLFSLHDTNLQLETAGGQSEKFPYAEISLILAATTVAGQSETTATVTERKFSLGKTMMAGGIPMTKKVKQEITVRSEERDEVLCLYAAGRAPALFRRGAMNYAGLGEAMQLSRELNFAYLKSELRRRVPQAGFDDRLLKRPGQVRLLGTTLDPDANLDLAFEILARTHPRGG